MRRLSPHLRQSICKSTDDYVDDTCAICLGELEAVSRGRLMPP